MKQQRRGSKSESSTEYWARKSPGQFLYVITFGPERRRRREKRRPLIAPWRPPTVMRPSPPAAAPKPLKQREDA